MASCVRFPDGIPHYPNSVGKQEAENVLSSDQKDQACSVASYIKKVGSWAAGYFLKWPVELGEVRWETRTASEKLLIGSAVMLRVTPVPALIVYMAYLIILNPSLKKQ